MKSLILLFIATTMYSAVVAATLAPDDAKALEDRATKIAAAFDVTDVDAIVEMTHPSLFTLMGGKDKMVEITRSVMSQLKAMEVKIIASEMGEPTEAYAAADELVCFYPRTTVMRVGDKKAKSTGFLICIRKAQGGEWLFLDASGLRKNPELLMVLLPALPTDVNIPENKVELLQ